MKITTYTEAELKELRDALMTPIKPIPFGESANTQKQDVAPKKEIPKKAIPIAQDKKILSLNSFILIIDDSDFARKVLRNALKEYGFDNECIIDAKNGEEGIESMMEFPDISLIITDLNMPKIDGLDFTSTMRTNKDLAGVHIWVLSSSISDDILYKFAMLDVEILNKPFKKQPMFELLDRIVKKEGDNMTTYKKELLQKKSNILSQISNLENEIKTLHTQLAQIEVEIYSSN
jgi:CheY-like chemotaxis protein